MENSLLRTIQICVGVIVLVVTSIVFFWLFPAMKSEVGAAWVQAVGSLAALLGVGWTVNTQESYRRKDAKAKGVAVAAAMTFRVTKASGDVERLREKFRQVEVRDCDPIFFQEALQMLRSIPQWTTEDLTQLAALENLIAIKLAGGMDRMNAVMDYIGLIVQSGQILLDPETRKYQAHVVGAFLWEIHTLYGMAGKRMNNFTCGVTAPFEYD